MPSRSEDLERSSCLDTSRTRPFSCFKPISTLSFKVFFHTRFEMCKHILNAQVGPGDGIHGAGLDSSALLRKVV